MGVVPEDEPAAIAPADGDLADPRPTARPRRVWRLVALSAAMATLGAGAVVATRDDAPDPARAVAPPTTAAAEHAPSPTLSLRQLPDLPELPKPGPLPHNAHEASPEIVLGTLEIPKLGVVEPLQEGMALTAINRGPSHWPDTALPGEVGNVVVAGHRVTYSKPFNRLDELVPGDQVVFRMADGSVHTYAVTELAIIAPEDLWIADQTFQHTATLFACHPKGSARQRIVAKLQLLDPSGAAVDDLEVPLSDLRRDAFSWELYTLPPDDEHKAGQPPNLSAPGVVVQHPTDGQFERVELTAEELGIEEDEPADPFGDQPG
jgi:sortase A